MASCTNCGFELPEGAVFCPKCGTSVAVPAQAVAPAASADVLKLATWGERFVAWLIDVVIIGAIAAVIGGIAGLAGMATSVHLLQGAPTWVPFVNPGLSEVFYFLYWLILEGSYGRSFGKMVMRLKVTRMDGSSMTMVQSAIQSVGKAFIVWLDVLLGWFLFSKKRQRVFNYLSGTIVVRAK
jgi:uncharacterized RDD family membrane protein YckC